MYTCFSRNPLTHKTSDKGIKRFREPSSSSISKSDSILNHIIQDSQSDYCVFDFDTQELKRYSLEMVKDLVQTEAQMTVCAGMDTSSKNYNNHLAGACIKAMFTNSNKKFHAAVNQELPSYRSLPQVFASSEWRPDVAIYEFGHKHVLRTTVEVISSPPSETIKKALMGGWMMIRYGRTFDINLKEVKSFVFPKCNEQATVIAVTTKFSELRFQYVLQPISLEEIAGTLEIVCQSQTIAFGQTLLNEPYGIRLSKADMAIFGEGAFQVPSHSAIIVQATQNGKDYIFKRQLAETSRTENVMSMVPMFVHNIPKLIIHLSMQYFNGVLFLLYPKIRHDPLNRYEGNRCCQELLVGVKNALEELHSCYYMAHMDIRLSNICINQEYKPILVDLDDCLHGSNFGRGGRGRLCKFPKFVMNLRNDQYDFVQLGMLILWLIDPNITTLYEMIPEEPTFYSAFFKSLIEKGLFDNELLKNDDFSKSTRYSASIEEVINERSK